MKRNPFLFKFIIIATVLNLGCIKMFSQSEPSGEAQYETHIEADGYEIPDSLVSMNDEDLIIIPPLFEYVVAPEDLPDLQSRTDYLMEHFWQPFDFKNTKSVDQNALNHAFSVYVEAMPYSSTEKVKGSVKKLISNLKSNPGLTYQFTKAAEENLYGPRAAFWADDIYMEFLSNLVNNKNIDDKKKKKYSDQLNLLTSTAIGAVIPDFNVILLNDSKPFLKGAKDFYLIEFTSPQSDDNRYTNLKLDISGIVNDMIEEDKLGVIVLMTGDDTHNPFPFPEKWSAGFSDNAMNLLDIRMIPCFYVIDKNNRIVGKNLTVDSAIELLVNAQ